MIVRPPGGRPKNCQVVDPHRAESNVQLKGGQVQFRVDEAADLRMDAIWKVLRRVERRGEKMEKERWRRDEARRLAVRQLAATQSAVNAFSGSKPSQAKPAPKPNPLWRLYVLPPPRCPLARRTAM
jgi:hypothetical protein